MKSSSMITLTSWNVFMLASLVGSHPSTSGIWMRRASKWGGGQKNSRRKYIFLKHKKQKYHIQSDNLELVTVIECISAMEEVVPPSFCLQEGSLPNLHGLGDDQW